MLKVILFLLASVSAFAQTNITVIGTSIEYGIGATPAQSWPTVFGDLLGNEYVVKNLGVPGGAYGPVSNPLQNYIHQSDIEGSDIVILGGPTNDLNIYYATTSDAVFMQHYQAWIDNIKAWAPGVKIYCNMAIKSLHSNYPPYRVSLYNEKVRAIAQENGLTVWSMDQLPATILSTDLVHPNAEGYIKMAELAHKELTSEDRTKGHPEPDPSPWEGF